jgi:hypothetical protein
VLLMLLLGSCSTPSRMPAPSLSPTPEVAQLTPAHTPTTFSTLQATVIENPTPTAGAGPVLPAGPAVLARYPLEEDSLGEVLTAGPGRVWVGTTFGTVQEWDTAAGSILKTYTLVQGAPDAPAPVKALAFDGKYLWVIVSSALAQSRLETRLFILDLAGGTVLQQFDLTENAAWHLGLAPGQVWLQNQVYKTDSQTASRVKMVTDSTVFAFDGQGWMWTAGGANTCDACDASIFRYKIDSAEEAAAGPSFSQQIHGMLLTGKTMWVATAFNQLDAYDVADPKLGITTRPQISLDLAAEMQEPPTAMAYDGHNLWLLSSVGRGGGFLYQYDPQNGHKLGSLQVGDAAGHTKQAHIPVDMAFDGQNLWVLTTGDLVKVSPFPAR